MVVGGPCSREIALGLKRPQLKSYPHIQGLYLLLRASGLGRIDGTKSRPVLVIDPAVYDSWTSLNSAERYFTLLETWLLRGHPEIVGERASGFHFIGSYFWECANLLQKAEDGLAIGEDDRRAHAFRAGVYVFKVSLGRDLWRRIAIPGALPLEDLAGTIIGAFEFTYDHLYQFSYRNRFGVETYANHPYMDEGPWASEVQVGDVPLQEGQSMTYLYDFGDQWAFEVTLERVEPPDATMKAPAVVDARGEVPQQYPSWEE